MNSSLQIATDIRERTNYAFYDRFKRVWAMENPDRLALVGMLSCLKPRYSIEIGTREGGSLAAIAEYSQKVFTIDIDPSVVNSVAGFSNVELLIGPSQEKLPSLLARFEKEQVPLEFVLIDGDHATEAVRQDIECFLRYRPATLCHIVMHDGMNPSCRTGMHQVDWSSSPYVHAVDLDFIPGRIYGPEERVFGGKLSRQMWGGLGIAVLSPEKRKSDLCVRAGAQFQYTVNYRHSTHRFGDYARSVFGLSIYGKLRQSLRSLAGKSA